MKKNIIIAVIAILGLTKLFSVVVTNKKAPVILGSDALLMKFSIDDMIKEADLIVISEVKTILPSKWKFHNKKDTKNATSQEIFEAEGLFTDSIISVEQILKGEYKEPIVRVRTFTGQTDQVRWENPSEPSYIIKRTYLLFLAKDTGATAKIDAGDYVSIGAYQGVYEIVNDKAISANNDEWVLEELIAYIQNSLSTETSSPTPTLSSTELLTETPLPFTDIPAPTDLPTETPLPIETASSIP